MSQDLPVSLPERWDLEETVFLNCQSLRITAVSASGLKEFYCNNKLLAMKTSNRNLTTFRSADSHHFQINCSIIKFTLDLQHDMACRTSNK